MTKHLFTKVSELYKDIHGYPLKGGLRKILKEMPEDELDSYYEDLINLLQYQIDEINITSNKNHRLFIDRLVGMMKDYKISLLQAMIWDADGLNITLSEDYKYNLYNKNNVAQYLNSNKLFDDIYEFYQNVLFGIEGDKEIND